ncbi:hypothetical protein PanWU01x14_011660 [Parasponia andersonii]|uniref:Transmembrane protein n=1 Tax=Parasponia andersonii TaxID=3476 RepID=A0A2P5E1L3_PARAD|nr:hypothetical protein PanWU01x14_011660 [Parasponia andersonii]
MFGNMRAKPEFNCKTHELKNPPRRHDSRFSERLIGLRMRFCSHSEAVRARVGSGRVVVILWKMTPLSIFLAVVVARCYWLRHVLSLWKVKSELPASPTSRVFSFGGKDPIAWQFDPISLSGPSSIVATGGTKLSREPGSSGNM